MKKIFKAVRNSVISVVLLLASFCTYAGGSSPGLYYGQVPTAGQWNSYFAAKLDYTPGAVNTVPYWDGSGSLLNAIISGDCTAVANVFTCAASSAAVATTTTITDDVTTASTMYPTWVTANTGNLSQKTTSTKLTFNPSTGALSSTNFIGTFAGNTVTTGTGVLTLGAGKTTAFNSTSTWTGTDAQTYTFPTTSATIARTDAAQSFAGAQTFVTVAGASSHILYSTTAPTIASGFGTSPSVTANNGTAAFTVNVGTGGTATSGVITMPAATTGWACKVSPNAAPQAAAIMYSVPTSATSITVTNYTLTTGAALAWTASTVISVTCTGY